MTKPSNYKHGMSHFNENKGHPLYNVWKSIKQRCYNPKCKSYINYGARGIDMCPEWWDSSVFISWALANGYKRGLDIDRINNEKGYSPDNCRFVTHQENCMNKRRRSLYGITTKVIGDKTQYSIQIVRDGIVFRRPVTYDIKQAIQMRDDLLLQLDNKFPPEGELLEYGFAKIVFIKGKDSLPRKEGVYFCCFNEEKSRMSLIPYTYTEYNQDKWLSYVEWYLQPCFGLGSLT